MNLCTLHQLIWSCASEEGRALPALTRQHLQRCARCREIVDSMQQVSARLEVKLAAPGENWHASVMQEIRCAAACPVARPSAVWPLTASLAAMAAIFVAVFFMRQEPLLEHGDDEATALLVASSFVSAAGEVTQALENEGAALQKDLQQALQIATSCLPF